MRTTIYIIIATLFVGISACCNDPHANEEEGTLVISDTTDTSMAALDTMLLDTGQYVDEVEETENLIEATYGEQWDFCACVVKNDSVNKAVETAETDADFERVLLRMEEIDSHCKAMLAMPNTTPEERQKHQSKVRKCLKNAS